MTITEELDEYFEKCFQSFEKNRMNPAGAKTPGPACTLDMSHYVAIVRGCFYLNKRKNKFMEPSQRKQCEDDLLLLDEVKTFIVRNVSSRVDPPTLYDG